MDAALVRRALPEGWRAVEGAERVVLEAELAREVLPEHVLASVMTTALARRDDRDEVLFLVHGAPFVLAHVHLTWSAPASDWPDTTTFPSIQAWHAGGTRA